jgi:anti-anti-sigma factor
MCRFESTVSCSEYDAMESENNGVNLSVLSDDGDLMQLRLDEQALRPDVVSDCDPMAPILRERGYARAALLSLADTDYVSSSGLALLLIWHKRFRKAGGKLVLHSITPPVMETLRILRMELVLNLAQDLTSALEAVRGDAT